MPTSIPDDLVPTTDLLNSMSVLLIDKIKEELATGESMLLISHQGQTPLQKLVKQFQNVDSQGSKALNELLHNMSITYLGGGNSQNFEITHKHGTKSYDLKLEMWSMPTEVKKQLELGLQTNSVLEDLIAPVYAEFSGKNSEGKIQILPIYTCDIETSASQRMSDVKRTRMSLSIFSQMAKGYEAFRESGLIFPDGKNANWLLDDQNNLRITDMKSILKAPDGKIDRNLDPEEGKYRIEKYANYYML